MATNADAVTQQSKAAYKTFCILIAMATVAVLAVLGLMGLFLL